MAGAGYKLFNTGDVLTAAQVNTYLQEQVVMVFANAAARTTALSGVLAEGMVSYLKDTDALEIYSGAAWVGYGSGDITGITTGATSGLTGGVTSGTADLKFNTTAKGGLLVGTGSGTVTELAVGSNTQVLTADSTTASGLKWAAASSTPSFVGCSVNYNADFSVANTTTTALPWNGELFDTDSFHDNTTNNSRITIPTGKGGYYLCFFHFKFNNNSSGTRIGVLRKNGSTTVMQTRNGGFSSSFSYCTLSGVFNLSAGDYLEVTAYQDTGGSLNTIGGTNEGMFGVQFLGA